MKIKINKMLKTLAGTLALTALVSCSDSFEVKSPETSGTETPSVSENPVIKFKTEYGARTLFPEEPALSALTDYTLEYKIEDSDWVSRDDFKNLSYAGFQNISLELERENVKKNITFELSATYGSLHYTARRELVINGGENEVELKLYRESLGSGKGYGNLSVSFDFSEIPNAEPITKVKVQLLDYQHNVISGEHAAFTGETVTVTNGTLSWVQNNVPAGSYLLYLEFLADKIPVYRMNPALQIAKTLTTYVTKDSPDLEIKGFNELYTITFDPNADGDSVIYTQTTKVSRFISEFTVPSPDRENYLFTGWYKDAECTELVELPVYKNTTVYAGWQSLNSQTEGLYPATVEKLSGIVSAITVTENGFGTKEKPATLKMFGSVTEDGIGTIETVLNTNKNVFFDLDFTNAENLTVYNSSYITENITGIILPASVDDVCSDTLSNYPALKKIEVSEENKEYLAEDNILYNKDKTYLYCYPSGLTEETFEVPESVYQIVSYSFQGGNLKNVIIPASVTSIEQLAFHYTDGITEFEVSEDNEVYSEKDGVVYSKDGTWLMVFPSGLKNFTVPKGVSHIDAYALYFNKTNLKKLSAEGNPAFFYYGGQMYTIPQILEYTTVTSEKEVLNYTESFIYIVDRDDAVEIQAYEDTEEVTDVSDASFTKLDTRRESDANKFFKLTTEPGTKYRVYWVDSNSVLDGSVTYTNPVTDLSDQNIYIFGANFNIIKSGENDPIVEFVAQNTTTYLAVSDGYSGVCAFRVRKLEHVGQFEAETNVSISITDPSDKFGLSYEKQGTTIYFRTSSGESYNWYVDGEIKKSGYTYFDFDTTEYGPDIYTITVEYRNGDPATASIQIEVE